MQPRFVEDLVEGLSYIRLVLPQVRLAAAEAAGAVLPAHEQDFSGGRHAHRPGELSRHLADGGQCPAQTQELLKAFWRYCVDQHWIPESPARTLSKIKPTTVQVQPFSHAEMEEILAACARYPTTNSFGVDNRAVITAFVLLLRWSGLRISDAVVLLWKNVQDGVLNVKCQKNGAHVTFRLNPVVSGLRWPSMLRTMTARDQA